MNLNCEKTNMLQGSGDIVSLKDQIVTLVNSSDQVKPLICRIQQLRSYLPRGEG